MEQVDFTWDGATLVEQTTVAPNLPDPVTLTWEHDGLRPLAQTERITDSTTQAEIDSRFFAIATDLVGAPTELFDVSGGIAWRTRRTLWGTTTWNADATAYTPLRFPGQYADAETGLHYNFHRHYDPTTARYLTLDPLGLDPAPNPTTYVHNPHTWTDPLGLAPDGCPQDVSPRTPIGHRGEQFGVSIPDGRTPRNALGEVNGIQYSGHAFDRMQEQGVVPSVVEHAMKPENLVSGKRPGTNAFHDQVNRLTVVTDSSTGTVITVRPGIIRQ